MLLPTRFSESLTGLVVAMTCVSAVFLLATTAIKYFAVDIVLFSRRFLPCTKARNGEYITELPSRLVKKT